MPAPEGALVWTLVAGVVSAGAAALPYDFRGIAAIPVAQALVPIGAVALLLLGMTSLSFRACMAALILLAGAVISEAPALTPMHMGMDCETDLRLTAFSFNSKLAGADPAALADLVQTTEPNVVVLLETDEILIDGSCPT